jgi:hypothetical protein
MATLATFWEGTSSFITGQYKGLAIFHKSHIWIFRDKGYTTIWMWRILLLQQFRRRWSIRRWVPRRFCNQPCPCAGIRVITVPLPRDFNSTGIGLSVPSVYRWTKWPVIYQSRVIAGGIPLWTNPSAFMKGAAMAGAIWWWIGFVLFRTEVGDEWLFNWTDGGTVSLLIAATRGSVGSGELRNVLAVGAPDSLR